MVCCAAFGCSNHGDRRKPGVVFHRFPKNPQRREAWVKAVRRKNWYPSAKSVLCSEHFLPEDIDRTSVCNVRIRQNAVPQVFPATEAYIQAKRFDMEKKKMTRVNEKKKLKTNADPNIFNAAEKRKKKGRVGRRAKQVKTEEDEVIEFIEKSEARKLRPKRHKELEIDEDEVIEFIEKSEAKKHHPRRRKELKTEEDEVIEFIEKSEARKSHPRRRKELKTEEDEVIEFMEKSKARKLLPRRRKELKTEEDEEIEFLENTEARKLHPKCVVCCRPLVNEKKEYLGTLTSTSGLSLHECLIGISGDKPTNIKFCTSKDMVCYFCAHLINYADKLEAELSKLKAAINGCLKINCMGGEVQDIMKPEFNSHIATLDEFGDRVVGPGSAADRQAVLNENPSDGVSGIVIQEVVSVLGIQEPSQVEGKQGRSDNSFERKVSRDKNQNSAVNAPLNDDLPVLMCKICHLKTTSRSVLLFHLRRHMANYEWCDFCDTQIFDEESDGD